MSFEMLQGTKEEKTLENTLLYVLHSNSEKDVLENKNRDIKFANEFMRRQRQESGCQKFPPGIIGQTVKIKIPDVNRSKTDPRMLLVLVMVEVMLNLRHVRFLLAAKFHHGFHPGFEAQSNLSQT